MPNNVKTYDGSDDQEDHLKIFQAAAKVERWAILTWCHMFNSTLTGFARCIKDPVEIHHIKQREGESTKDFVQRFKYESRHVKGAPKCMRISGFMHGITNPKLIKRLHDNIQKSVDEMMRVTTAFLGREVAASNQARKKTFQAWKQQEVGRKQDFDRRGDFRNQQRSEQRHDKFTLLIKSPKEILALDKDKFKAPPPMTTLVEKRNNNKFYEFHGEVGHNTDDKKDQAKEAKKGETSGKDKPLAILMVQPSQRVTRQKIIQSFSPNLEISFPPLGDEDGTEGLMILEAEIGGHFIHRIYRTPHWLQWRNHMANGKNIAAGKNRGCRAFHLYMDEFFGGKITISIQWDHWKAGSKEDSSIPINSSGNAKIPSPMRDTHSAE
ncbi:hypothetical protein Tco_0923215 [Tanacetum coccineum]|uniref:Reverse transcriptase domain-containing protein n=1 Tax=Tanacetum coccineum TaxID=301880 RepID=A0ABQ5D0E4_9ASTR